MTSHIPCGQREVYSLPFCNNLVHVWHLMFIPWPTPILHLSLPRFSALVLVSTATFLSLLAWAQCWRPDSGSPGELPPEHNCSFLITVWSHTCLMTPPCLPPVSYQLFILHHAFLPLVCPLYCFGGTLLGRTLFCFCSCLLSEHIHTQVGLAHKSSIPFIPPSKSVMVITLLVASKAGPITTEQNLDVMNASWLNAWGSCMQRQKAGTIRSGFPCGQTCVWDQKWQFWNSSKTPREEASPASLSSSA